MSPDPLLVIALIAVVMAAVMAGLWAIQRRTGDAGIVDAGWSAGVGAAGLAVAITGSGDPGRRILLGVMIAVWSARLAIYILRDRLLHGTEDGRYRKLRAYWGDRAQPWLFVFFQAQALLVAILAIPLLPAAWNPRPLGWPEALAAALWVIAVAGESLADAQLAAFRANPTNRGRTCRAGLWRYSRHPNYFFEWLHWWAYVPLAWGAHLPWLALLGPALMIFFLYRVTGIPYTEAQALESRGDDYRDYQRTTSAFVPWFPKRSSR